MPERVFKYFTTPELIDFARQIGGALVAGSTNALRNNHTGFLVETSALSQSDLRKRMLDIRYELYLRGRDEGDAAALAKEPKDPRLEKVMSVEVYRQGAYSVGPNGNLLFPPTIP